MALGVTMIDKLRYQPWDEISWSAGLVVGGRIWVKASTMEANAALRTIVRKDKARTTGRCWR